MIRGLYTSAWGMIADTNQMDVISNNLANVNTNSYKEDKVIFQSFNDFLTERLYDTKSPSVPDNTVGNMSLGTGISQIYTNFANGPTIVTNNELDLQLEDRGNSFFMVLVNNQGGQPYQAYTRDGSFSLDSQGRLVTKEGNFVLGENGIITLGSGNIKINPDGTIVQNDQQVGKLAIQSFQDPTQLMKTGSNLYLQNGAQAIPFTGNVRQGSLEGSNVNTVKEMVDMISCTRSYETNQKLIQAQDETLGKAVNEVGVVK